MNTLVDSDIQRFVACLVLGYLENQQLQKAYGSFCETSRHLAKEKRGLKYGNKPLDTSFGLVNIVREYFLLKSRINEFLRQSPHYPIIIKLIDTEDTLLRLDIILKALKDCLERTEKAPNGNSKKRKLETNEENEFNISQTNTSTPDVVNPSKRSKKSLTTPFLTLSANKELAHKSVDKSSTSRAELNYQSSSDTSEKEDDDVEEEAEQSQVLRSSASPTVQVLKEKQFIDHVINDIGVADKVADLINKTLSAKDLEPSHSNESQDNGSKSGLQDILTVTQNDPSFDEIINDVIEKYLMDNNNPLSDCNVGQTSTSSDKVNTESEEHEEVPIKQRLRSRPERKAPISERKRVNIISNEPYTGIVPAAANLQPSIITTQAEITQMSQIVFIQNGIEMIPILQTVPTIVSTSECALAPSAINSVPVNSVTIHQNGVQEEQTVTTETVLADKREMTPKLTLYPSFLESKSKSTPRRKHVRILDFNQTPAQRKLETIKEFSTPSNGIPSTTPSSAPPTVDVSKSATRTQENNQSPLAVDDDNSNSNSITRTPKVIKRCRSRKIAVLKSEEKSRPGEEELKKPATDMTLDDWNNMRSQSKAIPIDQLLRMQNQEVETTTQKRPQRRRASKAKVETKKSPAKAKAKKSPAKAKKKEKEKSPSVEIDENKPLSSIKFKIASPRKVASAKSLLRKKKERPFEKPDNLVEKPDSSIEKPDSSIEKPDSSIEKPDSSIDKLENSVEQEDANKSVVESCELNRSDTVQEVAMVLTNFPETIMSRHRSTDGAETKSHALTVEQSSLQIDQSSLLETPFKHLMTPLPNTPRFAIPLMSAAHETPLPKTSSTNTVVTLESIVKNCDIPTPNFAITPGFKLTPLKNLLESPEGGYTSRRTDYSSSSSYYKPEECDDINQKINAIIIQRREDRLSQSESETGEARERAKTVECPGAMERVGLFNEESTAHPAPHYTMMDGGLLSESFVTTAESSSGSSNFTCSTCSTDSTENTMDKLSRFAKTEEKDSEWDCDDPTVSKDVDRPLMNQKTGEVRFPLRNWITPKKIDLDSEPKRLDETNKIRALLHNKNNRPRGLSIEEENARIQAEQEAVKKRTLAKIRSESAAIVQPKYKKSQVKNYKLPPGAATKPAFVSRGEQILRKQFSERPRPTPLQLIPSTSSSRRKNATPRKTIPMNELPREQPSSKKKKAKSDICTKQKRVSEGGSDNPIVSNNKDAVLPADSESLEISSSFNTSNEEETANTSTTKQSPTKPCEPASLNGNKLPAAKDIPAVDILPVPNPVKEVEAVKPSEEQKDQDKSHEKKEDKEPDDASDEESDDESDDEVIADDNEKRDFLFEEPNNFKAKPDSVQFKIYSLTCRIDDCEVNLTDTNNIDLLTINPDNSTKTLKNKKTSPKKPVDDKSPSNKTEKVKPRKPIERWDQSKVGSSSKSPSKSKPKTSSEQTVPDISAILATIHGK